MLARMRRKPYPRLVQDVEQLIAGEAEVYGDVYKAGPRAREPQQHVRVGVAPVGGDPVALLEAEIQEGVRSAVGGGV